MKKIWNKIKIGVAVAGFTIMGIGIGAFVKKDSFKKIEGGFIFDKDGDGIYEDTAWVFKQKADTSKGDTATLKP
jgi:hypothetical protein